MTTLRESIVTIASSAVSKTTFMERLVASAVSCALEIDLTLPQGLIRLHEFRRSGFYALLQFRVSPAQCIFGGSLLGHVGGDPHHPLHLSRFIAYGKSAVMNPSHRAIGTHKPVLFIHSVDCHLFQCGQYTRPILRKHGIEE